MQGNREFSYVSDVFYKVPKTHWVRISCMDCKAVWRTVAKSRWERCCPRCGKSETWCEETGEAALGIEPATQGDENGDVPSME